MHLSDLSFRGIVFFEGREHFPGDVVMSVEKIREWAVSSGLIWDPEAQLLTKGRIANIFDAAMPGDELMVALAISTRHGKPEYYEYPFLSVRSLIKRGTAVPLVYWRVIPTQRNQSGTPTAYGEVRFGFLLAGCSDEFCSISTAARIVPKFISEMDKLAPEFDLRETSDGERDLTVDGAILATFSKQGRLFDVELSRK